MESEDFKGYVYIPENYPGPIAIDIKPSEACKEYHRNSKIQINISKELKERLPIDSKKEFE